MSGVEQVVISREQSGSVNGKPLRGRVYVKRVLWSNGIYSSTHDVAEATRFDREVAERMLAEGTWRHDKPRTEGASA